jgi:hypothetical protein
LALGYRRGAGYPGWETFVTDLARELELPSSKDLLTIAQFVVNRDHGRNLVNRRIIEEFTKARDFTETHRQLASLPLKTFWTTNYDSLLEDALRYLQRSPEVKKSQEDLARRIPNRMTTVLKMHGDAETPQEAVLIREDYEDYVRTRELFVDVLTADLLMKTFVFLGVSFNDPNLMFLLGRLRSIYQGARKQHFWVAKRPDPNTLEAELFDLRIDDLLRYGIRTVVIERYTDLAPLLAQIHQEYQSIRRRNAIFFAGSVRDDNPKAHEIREFAQRLAERMITRGYTIITGLGRGIGTWVTTAALEAIYQRSVFPVSSERVVARPFPVGFEGNPIQRQNHRKRMIAEAGFCVFISGRGEQPSGMREEYAIARELGSYTIPIGASGADSADLWLETKRDLDAVFGLRRTSVEDLFNKLNDLSVPLIQQVDTVYEIVAKLRD